MTKKKIVVIGGGFAGVEAVIEYHKEKLKDLADLIWIDKNGRFVYLPALPELISGKVTVEDVTGDLKRFASKYGVEFYKDTVEEIDLENKVVKTQGGLAFDYDFLILGIGAEPTFFNVKGCECAYPAYHLDDYLKIVEKLKELDFSKKPRIIVVGAGLTGVEVAGELVDYIEDLKAKADIYVIEKVGRAVPFLGNEKASRLVEEYLERRGVRFFFGKGVAEVKPDGVILEDGQFIEGDLVIWTAGVAPNSLAKKLNLPKRGRGWIVVKPTIQVEGYDEVYAPGDINCAQFNDDVAMKMAEEAMFQAKVAIANIKRTLEGKPLINHKIEFSIKSPKSLISLGGNQTVLVYGRKFAYRGRLPYLIKKIYVEKRYMGRFKD